MSISPLDVFLWTVRRNEKDVVNLYDKLSPLMYKTTGSYMLNFGLWGQKISDPVSAQQNMCLHIAKLSEFNSSEYVVDVGSGISAPAKLWKSQNPHLNIFCVNTNFGQLSFENDSELNKINSTATSLPFTSNSLDRIVALESAQHFKPLENFFKESARILKDSGILTLAIPVTREKSIAKNLGILNFTWSSEHYHADYVINLASSFFKIISKDLVGQQVYLPLANYYHQNRLEITKNITQYYSSIIESIIYKSILKMENASKSNIIDYLILKCKF